MTSSCERDVQHPRNGYMYGPGLLEQGIRQQAKDPIKLIHLNTIIIFHYHLYVLMPIVTRAAGMEQSLAVLDHSVETNIPLQVIHQLKRLDATYNSPEEEEFLVDHPLSMI